MDIFQKDALWDAFNQELGLHNRENFDLFFDTLDSGLVKDLDERYATGETEKYERLLNNIKEKGVRVFRDGKGKHKLKFI